MAFTPSCRQELLDATDEQIEDAVGYGNPMVLRAIVHQLTGDRELRDAPVETFLDGFYETRILSRSEDVAMVRRKAVEFMKSYRDRGAPPIEIGSPERLRDSIPLMYGVPLPAEDMEMYREELALDPWARGLSPRTPREGALAQDFTVTIIGAGMGGLNAAVHLKRAGFSFRVFEKNPDVGGTWYENRYPGARLDTPSRSYTNLFGANFGYPSPFCEWKANAAYFNWVAEEFDLRKFIAFNTEVDALTWDEDTAEWIVTYTEGGEQKFHRSNAVISAVGLLNRPLIPDIPGRGDFAGRSWHTSRWPEGADLSQDDIAVIGTGATGLQMIPELALQARHVTVFMRSPQWLFPIKGYRDRFPEQVRWLDRNLPFHVNFMRARTRYSPFVDALYRIDPDFDDPDSCSANNKAAREFCIDFLRQKFPDDEDMVAALTPGFPLFAARPVMVDPEYSILDALKRDNVTLVRDGVKRINARGVEDNAGRQHDADAIVFATGFRATEFLHPMKVTGRNGKTLQDLWADGSARAYRGCMMPGFPNLWSVYGPNSNGGLGVSTFQEMVGYFALQLIDRLRAGESRAVEVTEEAYWSYNELVDAHNNTCVWSDPRAHNYFWTGGRSSVMNPFTGPPMWRLLKNIDDADLIFDRAVERSKAAAR